VSTSELARAPAALRERLDPRFAGELVALRRAIHAEPELSMLEVRTAERLEAALRSHGIDDVRRVGATGLVARVPGRQRDLPPVALRGDIDALPIGEETGLPYASQVPGVMHACGHDIHASWAVGAAWLLALHPAEGDVLVVLQPGEETGRGALTIIEADALDGVRAIFGGHVDMRFPVGQVVAEPGPLAASSDTFSIELVGRGAHAARPHESADPIVGAATLVVTLQSVVARRLNPATPGVLTVGAMHAGSASNVIPDRAMLTGTIRAIDAPARRLLIDELHRVANGVAAAHALEARAAVEDGTPPLLNALEPTGWARVAVETVLGADALVPLGTVNMAAEDFAHYLERIPGCFLRIGAGRPGEPPIAAHSPRFDPAEESLFVGAAVLAECAREASSALSPR